VDPRSTGADDDRAVHDVEVGRALRALRRRRGWRQRDLADRAGVSQSLVSLAERGHLDRLSLAALRTLFVPLDARVATLVQWRGGALDRLLDEDHALAVAAAARLLEQRGWDVRIEVTYSVYGERGSIDLLARHLVSGALLVVEVKTELTSVEATIRKLDEKTRLAPGIAADRMGWRASTVARLLLVVGTAAQRRRVARHDGALVRAFPMRRTPLRRWLREPTQPMSGLLFLSVTNGGGRIPGTGGRERVRCPRPRSGDRRPEPRTRSDGE
jgi:transcriptional regulator with XRE-family HTH domain